VKAKEEEKIYLLYKNRQRSSGTRDSAYQKIKVMNGGIRKKVTESYL
jgi:hypothetical protein